VAVASLIEGVCGGERRAIARAISMVEDGDAALAAMSAGLFARTGRATTIGLTGAPGVGKSTLAGRLVTAARTRGRSVGVLAIDPTSPSSGGALLGDRVRMQEHATDPRVFIRSMATRGHLGGMALAAPEAIRILDAAGFEIVIVETVGVGQAELDVATATDTTIVVVTPGWGDAIQVSKAGILEVADVFVVNKTDRDEGGEAVRDLESMVRGGGRPAWMPPVIAASASLGRGIDRLWEAVTSHGAHLRSSGELRSARRRRLRAEVAATASATLGERVDELLDADPELVSGVADRRVDPYEAARVLLERAARRST
jgi:LAO/AO transport system kinase